MHKEVADRNITRSELLRRGFIGGIGWAFGVTIGFALLSTLLVLILRGVDSIPVIGDWIANIVEATEESLQKRSILGP